MIDHVFITVSDIARSRVFYAAALKALGWRDIGIYRSASGPEGIPDLYGYGDSSGASIWLRDGSEQEARTHIGFVAGDHASVDRAYRVAIAAGGQDNGEPAIRDYFAPGYYAGNVLDPDGNSIEFVSKG